MSDAATRAKPKPADLDLTPPKQDVVQTGTTETALVPAQESEAAAMVHMIERVARDPNANVEKVRELFKLRQEMLADDAKRAYDAALSEMQPALPVVDRKGRITIRDKTNENIIKQSTPYALFEDINEAIRPVLAKHGFALSFRTGLAGDGKINVTGILSHKAGHREETTMTLPHDSTGSKNAVQAVGSSTSYGKRYVTCALLNISTRGEDDDGKAGGDDGTISDEQSEQIAKLIQETKSDVGRFLKYIGAPSISDIPSSKFEQAKSALEAKRGNAP